MQNKNENLKNKINIPMEGRVDLQQPKVEIQQNFKGNPEVIRVMMILLFILCLFTLYFAMQLVNITTDETQDISENMWVFFLMLPISIASLIFGIIYKRKGFKTTKNIVVGIIFTVLLTAYGSFTFFFSGLYSHDFSYVGKIETAIHFDLPNTGDIIIHDYTQEVQFKNEIIDCNSISDIKFTAAEEVAKFNKELKESELWLTAIKTNLIGFTPYKYQAPTYSGQYDYYMIYNIDLKSYNTIPKESDKYSYIFIAYSSTEGKMKIYEYSCKVFV